MKIVVCVKQVPNTMEVKIDPKTGTLIRDKAPAILNTFDEFAIEESVQIREKLGGEVVALTMGPPNAKEVLLDDMHWELTSAFMSMTEPSAALIPLPPPVSLRRL